MRYSEFDAEDVRGWIGDMADAIYSLRDAIDNLRDAMNGYR